MPCSLVVLGDFHDWRGDSVGFGEAACLPEQPPAEVLSGLPSIASCSAIASRNEGRRAASSIGWMEEQRDLSSVSGHISSVPTTYHRFPIRKTGDNGTKFVENP